MRSEVAPDPMRILLISAVCVALVVMLLEFVAG